MTPLLRLLAVVLWHAGFAPSEPIERQMAAIHTYGRPEVAAKNEPRAVDAAAAQTGREAPSGIKYR